MRIRFDEALHTYTHVESNENYISVTTLIDKYVPEFDESYWSLYKAIKDVLEIYNQFKVYKLSVGGWEQVVSAWRQNPLIRYSDEVQSKQEDYLLTWKRISEEACMVGTAEHKRRELELCKADYYEHDNISYQTPAAYSQADILHIQDFASNRLYTELLVYNDEYMVAGQVDLVRKMGKRVWIRDYKTSKEITKKPFRDEKLLTPLNDLPNANWYVYNLQLSAYAWILEQCGYIVEGLDILHTRSKKIYDVPYLRDHVQMMMDDYATF